MPVVMVNSIAIYKWWQQALVGLIQCAMDPYCKENDGFWQSDDGMTSTLYL